MRDRGRLAGSLAMVALAVAACGTPTPSPPTAIAEPSPPVASPTRAASGTSARIEVDRALLDVLPATVDGIERQADAETAAQITSGAGIAESAEAIAVGVYVSGPAPSGGLSEYAVVTVTRLRPGVYDDRFHRDWRDSFDAGVCEQAGGVSGNAEATIGDHRTFIGTCAGGVRTYHVALPDRDILVSMQALAEGRLGERIVAGLAE